MGGETVFYPTYSSGTMVQGLVAAFGTADMADRSSNEHVAISYWPKAVTVASGKLWVAWQNMDKATVNRYSKLPIPSPTLSFERLRTSLQPSVLPHRFESAKADFILRWCFHAPSRKVFHF